MIGSILVGFLLMSATVGIHATGTSWWIQRLQKSRHATSKSLGQFPILQILCSTALLLLSLHILEVVLWAIVYLQLPALPEISTLEQATYFSTVTYTALGYGDIVIGNTWRLLSAIQAAAGMLIFGWSGAFFYAIVQRIWILEDEQR